MFETKIYKSFICYSEIVALQGINMFKLIKASLKNKYIINKGKLINIVRNFEN